MTDVAIIPTVCKKQLSFLVERFGFSPPETERIGQETCVRYHRGDNTVSIAWEPGLAPVVELFYPPQSPDDKVEPWAERNGVQRTRRFPRVRPTTKFNPNDLAQLDRYFADVSAQLAKAEESWLAT